MFLEVLGGMGLTAWCSPQGDVVGIYEDIFIKYFTLHFPILVLDIDWDSLYD